MGKKRLTQTIFESFKIEKLFSDFLKSSPCPSKKDTHTCHFGKLFHKKQGDDHLLPFA